MLDYQSVPKYIKIHREGHFNYEKILCKIFKVRLPIGYSFAIRNLPILPSGRLHLTDEVKELRFTKGATLTWRIIPFRIRG